MTRLRPSLRRLLFDPASILFAQGMRPDPWQEELLARPGRQVLLNCSRQCGKSRTVSALAVHQALVHPESLVLLLSPTQRQSAELFRKVLQGYRAVGQPVPHASRTQFQLELTNGSRVISLPGVEESIRSFSAVALLAIDEAARVPDDLYRAVRPMLAVSRGRLVCLSTPCGRRGFFHREWTDAAADWQRIRIPWQDCPRITADFIAAERRALGDSWVRQEYECSFEALEGLVFPDFARQVTEGQRDSETKGQRDRGTEESRDRSPSLRPAVSLSLRPSVGGIDFGYRNPFAAVWGRVDADGVLWITGEHYQRQQTIHQHARRLPAGVTWYADPAGAEEIAALRQLGHVVRKGGNDLRAGIAAVRARLEAGKLRVIGERCPNLLAEAQLYRYPVGESETPIDDHNHALAALRYLVARLDQQFIRQYLRQVPGRDAANAKPPSPDADAD